MNFFFGFMLIIFGLLGAISPETILQFDFRRILYYDDAEPSDLGLFLTRLFSVVGIIAGVACLFNYKFFLSIFRLE